MVKNLSVIIPSKTTSNLLPCIEAIRLQGERARIIIVDDFDDLHEKSRARNLAMQWSSVEFIDGFKPFVFSANMNAGIQAAGDDDCLLLNDDALLKTPGGFTVMQKAAEENPQFGIIGSTTNVVGNQNQRPKGIGLREDPRMVCFICVLIPRRTIETVGLMDEEFVGYGFEDDSYSLRVRRAGLKIGIHDGCYVDHGSLKSTFRGDPRTPGKLEVGRKIFIEKYGAHPL